ncbi:unnamed protein product [Zymoseptoria tritici ST99CH_3D7]|uniref:PNPLA domain-containing protein n=2 Tax=Zymoseptoria tritici TaxID=1047171 RepID=A0A1X7RJU5_ZYMT9|nr:unnamed protein product [Zymoseptoria tritici ST99CH_3D7]SMR46240.1 unnamed protein product [Zymoseptoria tritici ST99CH_1E4]
MASNHTQQRESPTLSNTSRTQVWPEWESSRNSDSNADSPWSRKIILSLDGGGVRGYASLYLLKKIMEQVRHIEMATLSFDMHRAQEPGFQDGEAPRACSAAYSWNLDERGKNAIPEEWRMSFLPHHYIDYFVGTSTGGEMDVTQAMKNYNDVGSTVFQKGRTYTRFGVIRPRFSSKLMDAALQRATQQDVVQRIQPRETNNEIEDTDVKARADKVLMRTESSDVARTVVVAHGGFKVKKEFLFRSYDHAPPETRSGRNDRASRHSNPGPASNAPLWVAGRATSAAPGYFSEIKYGGDVYEDGAMAKWNNPVELALKEVEQMHWRHQPKLIISIGTGQKSDRGHTTGLFHRVIPHEISNLSAAVKTLKKNQLNSHVQHQEFESRLEQRNGDLEIRYIRFDAPLGLDHELGNIKLGEWRGSDGSETKHRMENIIDQYLELDHEAAESLRECAKTLVDTRTKRARTERWERKALHLIYCCSEKILGTDRPCRAPPFKSRGELRRHAVSDHGFAWKVPCKWPNNTHAAQWTCFSDHCGELKVSGFDSQEEFEGHLREVHQHARPKVMTIDAVESWLSACRSLKEPARAKTTTGLNGR